MLLMLTGGCVENELAVWVKARGHKSETVPGKAVHFIRREETKP